MADKWRTLVAVLIVGVTSSAARAWDHPGHMTAATIAYSEVERARPDLIDKIGAILLKHPEPALFWVAAEDEKGRERTRRMFIEASRWTDDARWTIQDRPTWHSVRWSIVTDDAPREAKALVESRGGRPMGNALEALRWTFLFLHEPAWENPSECFKAIQALLKDRPHTFFAGHLHYYDYNQIDGYEHITMGPAGASFHHEGPGNVDHMMWVTVTDAGPKMANIALKGVFDRKGLDPEMFGAYDRKGAEN